MVPLVIQDRMFDTNGQLFFPADSGGGVLWALNPEHPYWVPEFVGDVIVVNGKSWPFLARRPEALHLHADQRLQCPDLRAVAGGPGVQASAGPPLWVVGTDGGYLDVPVKIDPAAAANRVLPIMPGERYWVIVDFAGYRAGRARAQRDRLFGQLAAQERRQDPLPGRRRAQGQHRGPRHAVPGERRCRGGRQLQPGPGRKPAHADGSAVRASTRQLTRRLTLNEVMGMPVTAPDPVTGVTIPYPGGPLEVLVNNTKWGGERITGIDDVTKMWMKEPIPGFTIDSKGETWVSELPKEGETEVWEIINLTADAHPIHLHLVQFQLLNRQALQHQQVHQGLRGGVPGRL